MTVTRWATKSSLFMPMGKQHANSRVAFTASRNKKNSGKQSRLLGTKHREKNRLPNSDAPQQHDEAVDAHAHSTCRGHRKLERTQEVLVEVHRVLVALRSQQRLRDETFALHDRVVQL